MVQYLILVVNDDNNLGQSVTLILQRAGYTVGSSSTIEDAIKCVQSGLYHMAILDNNMPGITHVLLPKIHRISPNFLLLILSDPSLFDEETKDLPLSTHYMVKPVNPERLLDYVNSVLQYP